jgi:branched-chain amino acid transport system ATP-binding protein
MSALLQAHGLTKSFGAVSAVHDVSFDLKAGERVALIGPNGAGKTTLVNLLDGSLPADRGVLSFCGQNFTSLDTASRARAGLTRTFQISRLFASLSALEHVALAILQREGQAFACGRAVLARTEVRDEAQERLAALGLVPHAQDRPGALPHGARRLLDLAIALALKPRVLLLDEPMAGLGRDGHEPLIAALEALPADLTLILVEHDMDVVFRLAQRIIVMAQSAVIFDGPADAARADAAVRDAYLGADA